MYVEWLTSLIVHESAKDVHAFLDALSLDCVDLLGFSIGGMCVQMVALAKPDRIRRLIIIGADPSAPAPEDTKWPRTDPPKGPIHKLMAANTDDEWRQAYNEGFFWLDEQGQASGDAYWERVTNSEFNERSVDSRIPVILGMDRTSRQIEAIMDWFTPNKANSYYRLKELKMPVLVMTGDDDVLIPTPRSWELMAGLDNAQLVIWPRSGHGSIWQYAKSVADRINEFLDSDPADYTNPQL